MWVIHYAVNGVIKRGIFKNLRGLQHYAQLLARPRHSIHSVQLDGSADTDRLHLNGIDRQFSDIDRHDGEAIQNYLNLLESMKEKHAAAKYKGDIMEMERIDEDTEAIECLLWPGKKKGVEPKISTLRRQKLGKPKTELTIHRTVGTAMRRAIESLIEGQMGELAQFLEMSVNPEGYSFAYRPLAPEPKWLL